MEDMVFILDISCVGDVDDDELLKIEFLMDFFNVWILEFDRFESF